MLDAYGQLLFKHLKSRSNEYNTNEIALERSVIINWSLGVGRRLNYFPGIKPSPPSSATVSILTIRSTYTLYIKHLF